MAPQFCFHLNMQLHGHAHVWLCVHARSPAMLFPGVPKPRRVHARVCLCLQAGTSRSRGLSHAPSVLAQRAADLLPAASLVDIARLVARAPGAAQDYNPFLSHQSCAHLQQAAVEWLKLCVLVRYTHTDTHTHTHTHTHNIHIQASLLSL